MTTDRPLLCRRCGQPENRHLRSHPFERPRGFPKCDCGKQIGVQYRDALPPCQVGQCSRAAPLAPAELVVKADTPQPCCLRAMRVDAGLSLRDMAKRTGRAPAEICDWEFGRAVPTEADVLAMSQARQAGRDMARTDAPLDQRTIRAVAAYLLDRADRYDTDSGCWVALSDAAENLMLGEAQVSLIDGHLDADVFSRVDGFARRGAKPKPVDPRMGTEEDDDHG